MLYFLFKKFSIFLGEVFFQDDSIFTVVFEEVSQEYKRKWGEFPFNTVYSILRYNTILKNHLLDFKYHRCRENIYAYEKYFLKMAKTIHAQDLQIDIIVFPPVFWWRKFFRGYNQCELLANMLAKYLKVQVKDIFKKIQSTRKQSTLSGEERMKNLTGSIIISEEFQNELEGKNILFIDDVISTGSTAKLCGDLLMKQKVNSITGVFLARGI